VTDFKCKALMTHDIKSAVPQLISTDYGQINRFSETDELETHLKSVRD